MKKKNESIEVQDLYIWSKHVLVIHCTMFFTSFPLQLLKTAGHVLMISCRSRQWIPDALHHYHLSDHPTIHMILSLCFYFPLLLNVRSLHLFYGNLWVLIYSSHDFIQATKHESTIVLDPMKRHSATLAWTQKDHGRWELPRSVVVSVSLPFTISFSPSFCSLLIIPKN